MVGWLKQNRRYLITGFVISLAAGVGFGLGWTGAGQLIALLLKIPGVGSEHGYRGVLETLQSSFPSILAIIVPILTVTFIVIPVLIWLVGVTRRRPSTATQTGYRRILHECVQHIIVATAFLIAIFIAIIASSDFLTVRALGGVPDDTGNVSDRISHVLSLSEVMFGFIGLLLAAATTLGGIFAWWLREQTKDAVRIAEEGMASLAIANHNIILSADLALMHLPSFTFTQQIPLEVLRSLQILNNVFEEQDREGHLWRTLSESSNGARIRYARALYLLGTATRSRLGSSAKAQSAVEGRSARTESILELLYEADRRAEGKVATSLRRDIMVRLYQALRQSEEYDEAGKVLNNLRAILSDGGSAHDRLLSDWGRCVLRLQVASSTPKPQRRGWFLKAAEAADEVFNQIAVRDPTTGTFKSPYEFAHGNPSILYYVAKAYWSVRFAYLPDKAALDDTDFQGADPVTRQWIEERERRFDALWGEADTQLDRAYERLRDEDSFTAAIYKAARAYLCIACRDWSGRTSTHTPTGDIELAKSHLEDGYRQARNALGGNVTIQIYCDIGEHLVMVEGFRTYLEHLKRWDQQPKSIFTYYQ